MDKLKMRGLPQEILLIEKGMHKLKKRNGHTWRVDKDWETARDKKKKVVLAKLAT